MYVQVAQDFSQVHFMWLSLLRLLDEALVDTNERTDYYGLDIGRVWVCNTWC